MSEEVEKRDNKQRKQRVKERRQAIQKAFDEVVEEGQGSFRKYSRAVKKSVEEWNEFDEKLFQQLWAKQFPERAKQFADRQAKKSGTPEIEFAPSKKLSKTELKERRAAFNALVKEGKGPSAIRKAFDDWNQKDEKFLQKLVGQGRVFADPVKLNRKDLSKRRRLVRNLARKLGDAKQVRAEFDDWNAKDQAFCEKILESESKKNSEETEQVAEEKPKKKRSKRSAEENEQKKQKRREVRARRQEIKRLAEELKDAEAVAAKFDDWNEKDAQQVENFLNPKESPEKEVSTPARKKKGKRKNPRKRKNQDSALTERRTKIRELFNNLKEEGKTEQADFDVIQESFEDWNEKDAENIVTLFKKTFTHPCGVVLSNLPGRWEQSDLEKLLADCECPSDFIQSRGKRAIVGFATIDEAKACVENVNNQVFQEKHVGALFTRNTSRMLEEENQEEPEAEAVVESEV